MELPFERNYVGQSSDSKLTFTSNQLGNLKKKTKNKTNKQKTLGGPLGTDSIPSPLTDSKKTSTLVLQMQ